tara:strand:- start:4735 stop:5862 length:1128 start_codon:yes stop_codon:yes gene_type:complete
MKLESLKNKKIGIIGATGFVGGRLFELLKEQNINSKVFIRNFSRSANLSKYHFDDYFGNMSSKDSIDSFIKSIDICFNCAHDFVENQGNMVKMIENLGLSCAENNTKLIHLSSVAVHEPMKEEMINETSDKCDENNYYGFTKILIENKLLELKKNLNLDLIIFRPTNIYGPFSGAWTINPCNKLINGKLVLTNESKKSTINLIYVDDVCNYMFKAAISNSSSKDPIYLINGPDEDISWSHFYEKYNSILQLKSIVYDDEINIVRNNKNIIKFLVNGIKNIALFQDNFFTKKIIQYLKRLPNGIKSKLKIYQKNLSSKLGELIYLPNAKEITDYKSTSLVSSKKAMADFNYSSQIDFNEGMKKNEKFIKWYFKSYF